MVAARSLECVAVPRKHPPCAIFVRKSMYDRPCETFLALSVGTHKVPGSERDWKLQWKVVKLPCESWDFRDGRGFGV